MLPIINRLPFRLIQLISPVSACLRVRVAQVTSLVHSVLSSTSSPGLGSVSEGHASIFHALRDSPSLPPTEKTASRLVAEARALTGAGTLTTAHMLSTTAYHILANPSVLAHLLAELMTAYPDPTVVMQWQDLEKLPYLTAVINEGLRTFYGIAHRLTRVHPDTTLTYGNWTIPAGVPVGMTIMYSNLNPAVFPDPKIFDPDRWLVGTPEAILERQKNLASFGRGTRNCVGMQLAYAEIYIALGTVMRRFGGKMRLFETEWERDVMVKKDAFVTSPGEDSRGVRVILTSEDISG